MIRIAAVIVIGTLILAGCKQKDINVNYKLSDEQLARLMFDIQLSEVALAEVYGAKRDSLQDVFWLRFTEIYKYSEPEIAEEIRNLEKDPEKMTLIMDRVQALSDSIQ